MRGGGGRWVTLAFQVSRGWEGFFFSPLLCHVSVLSRQTLCIYRYHSSYGLSAFLALCPTEWHPINRMFSVTTLNFVWILTDLLWTGLFIFFLSLPPIFTVLVFVFSQKYFFITFYSSEVFNLQFYLYCFQFLFLILNPFYFNILNLYIMGFSLLCAHLLLLYF